MSITSKLKGIFHAATPHPLAGFIREADNTTKLDVAVSEITAIDIASIADVNIKLADSPSIDAFGRLRVADTGQRADVEFTYDTQTQIVESIVAGAGTIGHNSATRDVTLAPGDANNGSAATLALHYHVPYTPGNGQLIDITGTLDYGEIGGGTAAIFLRNAGADRVLVPQGSWTNGVADVDWTKSQIFSIDFQSLKVGRIRFGLVRNGIVVPIHEIYNDNIRANGYWQYPNLPLNWRIFNANGSTVAEIGYFNGDNGVGFRYTLGVNANAQMLAICGTVKSEAGFGLFDMPGFHFEASNLAATKTVSTTLVPLLSIQLKATFNSLTNRGLVIPIDLSFVTDNPLAYQLLLNPTLTGAAFGSVDAQSLCNYDVTASAVANGRVIGGGYAGSGSVRAGATREGFSGRVPLSVNYAGSVGDILTVAAVRIGTTNASAGAAIEWKEIR